MTISSACLSFRLSVWLMDAIKNFNCSCGKNEHRDGERERERDSGREVRGTNPRVVSAAETSIEILNNLHIYVHTCIALSRSPAVSVCVSVSVSLSASVFVSISVFVCTACLPLPLCQLALSAALIKFSLHNQKAPKNISLLNNPLDSELNVCKLFECRFHSHPFASIRSHLVCSASTVQVEFPIVDSCRLELLANYSDSCSLNSYCISLPKSIG